MYEYVFGYTCHVFLLLLLCVAILLLLLQLVLHGAAGAAWCCCSSSCAGWQKLLLWLIASDSTVFFLLIQTQFTFDVRTPWLHCRICSLDLPIIRTWYQVSYILGNYGHVRSQDGPQPAAAKPPLYFEYVYLVRRYVGHVAQQSTSQI